MLRLSLSAAWVCISDSHPLLWAQPLRQAPTPAKPCLPRHSSGSHFLPLSPSLDEKKDKNEVFGTLRLLIKHKKGERLCCYLPPRNSIPVSWVPPLINIAISIIHWINKYLPCARQCYKRPKYSNEQHNKVPSFLQLTFVGRGDHAPGGNGDGQEIGPLVANQKILEGDPRWKSR